MHNGKAMFSLLNHLIDYIIYSLYDKLSGEFHFELKARIQYNP
jgi:hypothetical protein